MPVLVEIYNNYLKDFIQTELHIGRSKLEPEDMDDMFFDLMKENGKASKYHRETFDDTNFLVNKSIA